MNVCVKCQVELRPHTNGIVAIEMTSVGPYKLHEADMWHCPSCGWQSVLGFSLHPFAGHFQPDFAEKLATSERDRVCVRFWSTVTEKTAAS